MVGTKNMFSFRDKNSRKFIIAPIIVLLAIYFLSYFFNIYPGGYSVDFTGNEVKLQKGAIFKEDLLIVRTIDNELKIALMVNYIKTLITSWFLFTFVLVISFILSYVSFGKTIALTILTLFGLIGTIYFIKSVYEIEDIINLLV